jgi:chitin disaccharide deacetylase
MILRTACTLLLGSALVQGATLAERLGYRATDRILIINGDDVGMCHAANVATIEAMEKGVMTSATIMVPCPWFLEIAEYAKNGAERKDFGLHLVHTSEWLLYKWGPVASRDKVPGLVDAQGYFYRSVPEVYLHATPEETYLEARAQIEKALAAGVDVTHLDSHMGAMQLAPRFLEMYIRLGLEYNLPVRMGSQKTFESFGFPRIREETAARGLVFPDYLIHDELREMSRLGVKPFWTGIIKNLKPGVTELYIHAAKAGPELQRITGSWKTRDEEYRLFTEDEEFRRLLEEEKIIRVGWRPLRDLQRKERPNPPAAR